MRKTAILFLLGLLAFISVPAKAQSFQLIPQCWERLQTNFPNNPEDNVNARIYFSWSWVSNPGGRVFLEPGSSVNQVKSGHSSGVLENTNLRGVEGQCSMFFDPSSVYPFAGSTMWTGRNAPCYIEAGFNRSSPTFLSWSAGNGPAISTNFSSFAGLWIGSPGVGDQLSECTPERRVNFQQIACSAEALLDWEDLDTALQTFGFFSLNTKFLQLLGAPYRWFPRSIGSIYSQRTVGQELQALMMNPANGTSSNSFQIAQFNRGLIALALVNATLFSDESSAFFYRIQDIYEVVEEACGIFGTIGDTQCRDNLLRTLGRHMPHPLTSLPTDWFLCPLNGEVIGGPP